MARASGTWCGRRDLNPHGLRHQNLNLACLPISPRPPGHGQRRRERQSNQIDLAVNLARRISATLIEHFARPRKNPIIFGRSVRPNRTVGQRDGAFISETTSRRTTVTMDRRALGNRSALARLILDKPLHGARCRDQSFRPIGFVILVDIGKFVEIIHHQAKGLFPTLLGLVGKPVNSFDAGAVV